MKQIDLPPWIEGFDRKVLSAYIKGVKPSEILKQFGIDHAFLLQARKRYRIPSHVELRKQGLIPATASATKKANSQASGVVQTESTATRMQDAVAEYVDSGGSVTINQLMKKYRLSPTRLSAEVKKLGYEIHRGRPKGTTEQRQPSARNLAIVDEVINKGRTLKEVGEEQDPPISRERVRQICAKAGYKLGYRDSVKAKLAAEAEEARYRHPEEDKIVELLRENRTWPKDLCSQFGVKIVYINKLRSVYKIPKSSKLDWRSDEVIERENRAIDYYFNHPEVTSSWISHNILQSQNPASITQLVKRRGYARTRAKQLWGDHYTPFTGTRTHYDPELKKQALADYQNPDMSIGEILHKYQIKYPTLEGWRRGAKLEPVRNRKRTPEGYNSGTGRSRFGRYKPAISSELLEKLDEALRTDASNPDVSMGDIAKRLGVTAVQVSRRTASLGLEFVSPHRASAGHSSWITSDEGKALDLAIKQGFDNKKTLRQISEEMKQPYGRVQRRAKVLGFSFPMNRTEKSTMKAVLRTAYLTKLRTRDKGVIDDYLAGMKLKELLPKHGIVNSQLYVILDRHSIERGKRKRGGGKQSTAITSEDQAIVDAYSKGVSRSNIFNRFPSLGNNSTKLDNLVARFNVRRPVVETPVGMKRQPTAFNQIQYDALMRYYKPGRTSIQQAADKTGMSYGTARKLLIGAGKFARKSPKRNNKKKTG